MTELKPCPFCGSKAKLIHRKRTKLNLPWAVACQSPIVEECHLYSGAEERIEHPRAWDDVLFWWTHREDAIAAWNRRSSDKP
jgi:hypothetical protein